MKQLLKIFFSIALSTAVLGAGNNGGGGTSGGGSGSIQANANADAFRIGPRVDDTSVIVQLNGDPLSTYVKTKPPQGQKIDFSSHTVKSYRAQLSTLRNDFKQWLQAKAPKAKVTGQYDISLNAVAVQLNGTAKSTIEQAPQAVHVEYEGIYYPSTCGADPDLGLISAIDAWNVNGGFAHAGEGVKVAIVDTGIDITRPCFSDPGYPTQPQLGDHNFTNNKVIAAKVFNNTAGPQGLTPAAIQDHGTHVAGTVGCNYQTPAIVNGVSIPYCPSGVAPRVLLGNYNVFPGNVSSARSEDILNALEAAYSDGFDIANMSLGGGVSGTLDLLTKAVDDLDQAGFISAVAAGNSGPGPFTIESPGSAARALTAGASTVPHFVGAPLTIGDSTYGLASGDFATVASDLTAPLGVVLERGNLSEACSALPAGSLTGKIALISRGTCTFSTKIRNVQNAGAIAAIVVNNVAGDPTAMGQDGTADQPTIPAYMTSLANRDILWLRGTSGFIETYDDGSDVGQWVCSFSVPRIIETSGGNPGAYLQQGGFSTHTPTWATASTRYQPGFQDTYKTDSVFTGDWAGAGVASISADLNIIQAGGWGPDRAVTLKLLQMDDTGFNLNFEATYTLPDLGKTPPIGWQTYSFPVNANSSKIPHGWVFTHGDGTPATDAEWSTFVHRIDLTSIGYYKPGFAYVGFGSWTLGIDNIKIQTVRQPSSTVGAALQYFLTSNADIMAGFSSQGPTDVDFRVKPDLVAPGVNVLSSIPLSFCGGSSCWAFFQGTSMATPHLAGSAAVVLGQHPAWSAAQVRSAIVNTADQGKLKDYLTGGKLVTDVNIIGTGRDNLLSAVNAKVGLDPVSVSFGSVFSISGVTKTYNMTLTNLSGSSATFSLSIGDSTGSGVSYSISPSAISLGAGDSSSATITMSAAKGSSGGTHQALLSVQSGGTEVAHAAVFTYIK
jgi:subtilisin family serine protease